MEINHSSGERGSEVGMLGLCGVAAGGRGTYFEQGPDDGEDDHRENGNDQAKDDKERYMLAILLNVCLCFDGGLGGSSYQLHAFSAETTGFILEDA